MAKMINIIYLATNLNYMDNKEIDVLADILHERSETIRLNQPISGSLTVWEEKYDDIIELEELCLDIKKYKTQKKRKSIYENLLIYIYMHQAFYGGLKRFKY